MTDPEDKRIMITENQHFDLQFFMKSTDAGLYNVALKIFSNLDAKDLKNLREIGNDNQNMKEFLDREQEFLWLPPKFETVPLKILKSRTSEVIGPHGETLEILEDIYRVAAWSSSTIPGQPNLQLTYRTRANT